MRPRHRAGDTGRARRARSPTTRPPCGCTRSSACSAGTTLQRILSTYFSRFAFKHPKPQDFFAVANEVSGQDLTWFFDQVYRGSNVFDYGVDTLRSETKASRASATSKPAVRRIRRAGRIAPRVVVRRYGEGIFPVDVRVVFENKEEIRWHWDGKDRWKMFEIEKPVARRIRRGRSRTRAAARRALHEQLDDPRAAGRARGAQMVARLAGLAAGSPAHLRLLRLMAADCRVSGRIRRVDGAPALLAGRSP